MLTRRPLAVGPAAADPGAATLADSIPFLSTGLP